VISILPNQVPDPVEIPVATRDANDDYRVALAREHDAVWIVTGDAIFSTGTNSDRQRLRWLRLRKGFSTGVNVAGPGRLRTPLDSKRAYVDHATNGVDWSVLGGRIVDAGAQNRSWWTWWTVIRTLPR
jgi:hypothetical protein